MDVEKLELLKLTNNFPRHIWLRRLSTLRRSTLFFESKTRSDGSCTIHEMREVKEHARIFGWHPRKQAHPERAFPSPEFNAIVDRQRQADKTIIHDSRQLHQSWEEGGERRADGRWKDTAQGPCLELLFPRVFTDERKRLNGQVGRRENDDTSFLPFAPSCVLANTLIRRRYASSTGCPKRDNLTNIPYEILTRSFLDKNFRRQSVIFKFFNRRCILRGNNFIKILLYYHGDP